MFFSRAEILLDMLTPTEWGEAVRYAMLYSIYRSSSILAFPGTSGWLGSYRDPVMVVW